MVFSFANKNEKEVFVPFFPLFTEPRKIERSQSLLTIFLMKKNIHPAWKQVKVICSCGNTFETGSTIK